VELRRQSGVPTRRDGPLDRDSSFTKSGVALLLASAFQKVLDQLFFNTQYKL
jgi:hypothetical protein